MTLVGKEFEHYHILKLVGRGSTGEVYLIEDAQVHRQIAAKIIRIEAVQSDNEAATHALRLFWREATVIARLDHPRILPLYDHGETSIDGSRIAYLIMPYRSEGSMMHWLRQRVRNRHTRQLTMKQAVHLIQQAGEALQYAHDHQVMHLDIKPANFLMRSHSDIDEYPDLLLSDFGIARLVNATSRESQQVRGTPIYMAPEQWASRPVFASDQYALAIMAYELLTGYPPFQGAPLSVMYAHTHQQPLPAHNLNPLLPSTIDPVLQRALAKKPEERFSSVSAFAQAFENAFSVAPREKPLRVLRLLPLTDSSLGDNALTPASDMLPHQRQGFQLTHLVQQAPQTSQALPLTQPSQEMSALPSTTSPRTALSAHERAISSLDTARQMAIPARRTLTLPPLSVYTPARRPGSLWTVIALSVALLLIISTGGLGIYGLTIGHLPWQATAGQNTTNTAHQAHATSQTTPGQIWQEETNAPKHLNNVLWLHALFLALGNNGAVFTSPDGLSWTTRHAGTTHLLEGATWADALFVVVGDQGTILTSPDANSWTLRKSGTSQNLYDVVWSGSFFLASGDNGTLLTSRDGTTWTSRVLKNSPSLYGIIWSGSRFVAVGDSALLTSSDGIIWTHPSSATQQPFDGIAWSGSLFLAIGSSGTVLTSRDGLTWTPQHSGSKQDLTDVDWSGSLFVIVGQNGTLLTSPDGVNWTPQQAHTTQNLDSVACSNGRFIVAGDDNLFTSP